MSWLATAIVSDGVPRSTNATISTRSSSPRSACRRLIATSPKRPTVNREKAIVVTDRAERSGARRKEKRASRLSSFTWPPPPARPLRCRRQAAIAHLDDPVGRLPDQVEVVGSHHHHSATRIDIPEQLKHPARRALIQI